MSDLDQRLPAKDLLMKKHMVKAQIQVLELTKAGSSMTFEIYADTEKMGTIVIGSGSLTWYGKKRKTGKSFSWTEFAKLMDEQVYG